MNIWQLVDTIWRPRPLCSVTCRLSLYCWLSSRYSCVMVLVQCVSCTFAAEIYNISYGNIYALSWRRVVKKQIFCFCGQADRNLRGGGGGAVPSVLTVSKCENFDPFFFHRNLILWYSKHILSHCEGAQKCILRYRYPTILKQESSTRGELGILVVGWKWIVSWVKSVPEHI